MSESQDEEKIQHFQDITNCTDQEYVVQFLHMYEWDVNFAIAGYMEMLDGENNNEPTSINSHRINSEETESFSELSNGQTNEQLTLKDNHSEEQTLHHSSMKSSPYLYNLTTQQQTANNSHQALTRTSFFDYVNQIVASPSPKTSPSIFLNISQFNSQQLIERIDANLIGRNLQIRTPWGIRTVKYADYTASGRGLLFVERYMLNNVLPYYSNTHSEINACASKTTRFREESRANIKKYVNATDDDVLIFVGSGSTGAINKLADVLGLRDEKIHNKMVVFISKFEHHSNILPWKETGVELVTIPNTKDGLLDEDVLQERLNHYHHVIKKQIICTFNAASNVTGIQTDADRISTLIHQYNGWSFWDYAAGAPYMKIDMNASETAYKDAVFISTHKFVGGPETPGILLAKKKLFTNKIPSNCGGGTVNYVTRTHTEYMKDIETREEGGTPNILGSIRAGLVFDLKEAVGDQFIEAREKELVKIFFDRFGSHKKLLILGSTKPTRLAIFSFLIYVPTFKKYLHHHFICALLNDLFGIQVRSGCSCAGPYVLDLLNIPDEVAEIYTKFITEDKNNQDESIPHNGLMKPGFTRLNLSYFASDEEVDYLLNALEFIAEEGWKFLSLYTYNSTEVTWRPRHAPLENYSSGLHGPQMITFGNGLMEGNLALEQNPLMNNPNLITYSSDNPIEQAKSMANNIPRYVYEKLDFRHEPPLNIPEEYQNFIWFIIPREVIRQITNDYEQNRPNTRPPFHPRSDDQ